MGQRQVILTIEEDFRGGGVVGASVVLHAQQQHVSVSLGHIGLQGSKLREGEGG